MIVLGLTGSIGMGKSTAGAMLETLGVPVHDSDNAVHDLLQINGAGYTAVQNLFPDADIYNEDGSLSRRALGGIIFHDDDARIALESALHPLVQNAQQAFIKAHTALGVKIVALDIPLLYETGADTRVDAVIVVTAPAHIQKERVMARDGMTLDKFTAILNRQMPDGEKCARADYVVQTGLGRAVTMKALKDIIKGLKHTS